MEIDPIVVSRYAVALFRHAQRHAELDRLEQTVQAMLPLLAAGSSLRTFLETPLIPKQRKKDLIERLIAQSATPIPGRFILVLLERNRVDHLAACLRRFIELVQESKGIYPARVTTAVELDPDQRGELQRVLETHTGRTLALEFAVDPGLLGGVIFRHGDEQIDTSLRGRLNEIRARIKPLKVH